MRAVGALLLMSIVTGCAARRLPVDRTIHSLTRVPGRWVRSEDGTVLLLTDSQRDVAAGVKEVCGPATVCTSEPGGVVTRIYPQGETKR